MKAILHTRCGCRRAMRMNRPLNELVIPLARLMPAGCWQSPEEPAFPTPTPLRRFQLLRWNGRTAHCAEVE